MVDIVAFAEHRREAPAALALALALKRDDFPAEPFFLSGQMSQQMELQQQLLGAFFEESAELLERLEGGLLALARQGAADAQIDDIFRAAHSLKGAAGTFGFMAVGELAHVMESLLDGVRTGAVQVTPEVTGLLLEAVDRLRALLETTRQKDRTPSAANDLAADDDLRQRLANASAVAAPLPVRGTMSPAIPAVPGTSDAAPATVWRIGFRPLPSLIRTGNDPLRILRELARMGALAVTCDTSALPELAALEPDVCHLSWQLQLTAPVSRADVAEVFSWVEGDADIAITSAAEAQASLQPAQPQEKAAAGGAVAAQPARADARGGADPDKNLGTVRVSVDKIDLLMNMVGELVITRSMLCDLDGDGPIDGPRLGRLREGLAQLAANTRLLQESVMRLRSMPVGVVFGRLPRMVHDLGRQLGKEVELKISGEATELDKTVLEKLGDPLVHLVRNSLDHGLETPAERTAAGKPARGTLELRAYHRGSSIVVEVADDGRGLDLAKILATARKRGLLGADEVPQDSVLREMIFAPGFSTASAVTDVSGRGVGMDVVRRNIKALGGEITIESTPGRGTRICLRLPLTLAIVDGQLVRVGGHSYVVPLLSILDLLEVDRGRVGWVEGGRAIYRLGDDLVPVVALHALLGEGEGGAQARMMVVAEADGQRMGLLVDELQSQQQVVVKSLESNYGRVEGLAGATILGDGSVAFILDMAGIRRLDRASLTASAQMIPAAAAGPPTEHDRERTQAWTT